ncbi:unnamed protein product [Mytilus coruscus]|uniref:Uncharacterized protein n=1 Tax=Mytilus coruscus TaxID=42192 RepID=A0A6J8EPA0_MYTCO|nr:unnamed protein product [Mytilus coruscus]
MANASASSVFAIKIAKCQHLEAKNLLKCLEHRWTLMEVFEEEHGESSKTAQIKRVYDLCKGYSVEFLKLADPPSDESEEDDVTAEYFSDMLQGISPSDNVLEYLNVKQSTIGQRENHEWQKHRKCIITASVVSNIMKCLLGRLFKSDEKEVRGKMRDRLKLYRISHVMEIPDMAVYSSDSDELMDPQMTASATGYTPQHTSANAMIMHGASSSLGTPNFSLNSTT